MTDGEPPSTEAGFRRDLQSLISRAHEAGVDVAGGWECRDEEGRPDWDVVISELQSPDSPE